MHTANYFSVAICPCATHVASCRAQKKIPVGFFYLAKACQCAHSWPFGFTCLGLDISVLILVLITFTLLRNRSSRSCLNKDFCTLGV